MKIAFFSDCYLDLTGGIVTSINAQKEELEKRGHEVYVFSSSFPRSNDECMDLAHEHIFPVPSCHIFGRGILPISRRPKIIERWLLRSHPELKEFDVFYIHYEAGCSIAGMRLGRKLGIPVVQVMHGREDVGVDDLVPFGFRSLVGTLLNWFHSWYLPHPVKVKRDKYLADTVARRKMWTMMVNHANYADLVLTPSLHFKRKLAHYGVKKEIRVLPNGINDSVFIPDLEPHELKKGETLRMIWHSRLTGKKRILELLEAMAILDKMHMGSTKLQAGCKLDVYGDGNMYAKARRYVRRHNLNVVFHGTADFRTVYRELQKSHLDTLVSYNFDTFGMTLIEAESAGVPSFIVDPDMEEVAPEGGYIISKDIGPVSMATALDDILKHPEKIKEMSELLLRHRDEVRVSRRIDELERIFSDIKKRHQV